MESDALRQIAVSVIAPLVFGIIGAFIGFIRMGEKVKQLEKDNDDEKKEIKEIRDKVIACETSLKEREPFLKRKSPVSLTDRGNTFLDESGGRNFVDNHFARLRLAVEERAPKTAYDIQEYSREVIDGMKEGDDFNILKEYLFKEGLELKDLVAVMGIYLRDKILVEKGLTPEEVDRHDPFKKSDGSKP